MVFDKVTKTNKENRATRALIEILCFSKKLI